jgi:hypothetical protein
MSVVELKRKDDFKIARAGLSQLHGILKKLSDPTVPGLVQGQTLESPVPWQVRWKIGKAMDMVQDEFNRIQKKSAEMQKKFKAFQPKPGEEPAPGADEMSASLEAEFQDFMAGEIVLNIPRIEFETVQSIISGVDLQLVADMFIVNTRQDGGETIQ